MTERLRNAPKLTNAEKQKPVFPKIIFEISTINTDYLKSKFPIFLQLFVIWKTFNQNKTLMFSSLFFQNRFKNSTETPKMISETGKKFEIVFFVTKNKITKNTKFF